MFKTIRLPVILIVLCLSTSAALAYEKGGMAFILDNGKKLNLNDEQKRKLNNLRVLEERTRNKILGEKDTKVALHKWMEAVRKKDDAGAGKAYEELAEKFISKSVPIAESMMKDLTKILTPQQIESINAMKEAADENKKPAPESKKNAGNKPKRGTEPPNPFEF